MTSGNSPGDDVADMLARYARSCDEMRTVCLSPRKAIPVDQWPEETVRRGSATVRAQDWKRYARYLLGVATENERLAAEARKWWAWWEAAQVKPAKAGPAPLVNPRIAGALRAASADRHNPSARGVSDSEERNRKPKRRKAGGTRRRNDLDMKACAAVATLEGKSENWRPIDVARVLGLKDVRSITGTKPDPAGSGRVDRCPGFMRLWSKQKQKRKLTK